MKSQEVEQTNRSQGLELQSQWAKRAKQAKGTIILSHNSHNQQDLEPSASSWHWVNARQFKQNFTMSFCFRVDLPVFQHSRCSTIFKALLGNVYNPDNKIALCEAWIYSQHKAPITVHGFTWSPAFLHVENPSGVWLQTAFSGWQTAMTII